MRVLYITDKKEKFNEQVETASQDTEAASITFDYTSVEEAEKKLRNGSYDALFFTVTKYKHRQAALRLIPNLRVIYRGDIVWGSTQKATVRELQNIGIHYFCEAAPEKVLAFFKTFP